MKRVSCIARFAGEVRDKHIKGQWRSGRVPLVNLLTVPFTYQCNRSTADAISLSLHSSLEHLDNKNTYVRLLFIDYSNAIIPNKLISKVWVL
eukprot:g39728.t1